MRLTPDLAPGGYLYLTRVGSSRGLVSYVWLEFAPLGLLLASMDLQLGLLFALCHWSFLGMYELGYLHNDRAATRGERPERAPATVTRAGAFIATRLLFLLVAIAVSGRVGGSDRAGSYLAAVMLMLLLLWTHTLCGVRAPPSSPARWTIFGWLAFAKYAPALAACLPGAEALAWCAFVFLCYGAGRVVEYAVRKHGGQMQSGISINACWFIVSLPACLVALYAGLVPAWSAALVLSIFGSHHVLATVARHVLLRNTVP